MGREGDSGGREGRGLFHMQQGEVTAGCLSVNKHGAPRKGSSASKSSAAKPDQSSPRVRVSQSKFCDAA